MRRLLHRLKGRRTQLIAAVATIIPVLELTEWRAIIPADYWPYFAVGLALLMAIMRQITTTPVGERE
jgi:hypothetical protein